MIEAILVISVMIMFYGGMVFFENLYDQQIFVQNQMRAAALALAMGSCNDTIGGYTGRFPVVNNLSGPQPVPVDVSKISVGTKGTAAVQDQLNTASLGGLNGLTDVASTDAFSTPVGVTVGSKTYSASLWSHSAESCTDETIATQAYFTYGLQMTESIQSDYQ